MIKLNSAFLLRFVRAATELGINFKSQKFQGIKEMSEYAHILLENPDSPEAKAFFDKLGNHRKVVQERVIHPGFRPKMDLDFQIAEKNNYFRQGKAYSDNDDPTPSNGPH